MHFHSSRSILSSLALFALLVGFVAPATGESGDPAALASIASRTQIQILPAALEPERVEAETARGFELTNLSTALARVEFGLRRGEGLTCANNGDAPIKGRKFVVESGASLVCRATAEQSGRLDYEVFRNVRAESGAYRREHSEGRIELR
jgi:hypothetical protein